MTDEDNWAYEVDDDEVEKTLTNLGPALHSEASAGNGYQKNVSSSLNDFTPSIAASYAGNTGVAHRTRNQLNETEQEILSRQHGKSIGKDGNIDVKRRSGTTRPSKPGAQRVAALNQLEESITAKMRGANKGQTRISSKGPSQFEQDSNALVSSSLRTSAKDLPATQQSQANTEISRSKKECDSFTNEKNIREELPHDSLNEHCMISAREEVVVGVLDSEVRSVPVNLADHVQERDKDIFQDEEVSNIMGEIDPEIPFIAPFSPSQPILESSPGMETYPAMQLDTQGVGQTSGIEAFVVEDTNVDATGVAVVMSEEEEERTEKKRLRTYYFIGFWVFLVAAVAIVVIVVLTVGKDVDDQETNQITGAGISPAPSFSPTIERMQQWAEFLTTYSGEVTLNNRTSPQYLALRFISENDELQTEVGSSRGLQRYLLACFYFATNGDDWLECGQKDPSCSGRDVEKPWLLEKEHECDWLGVVCDVSKAVTALFFPRGLGNGLKGYLPPEVAKLTELQSIVLHGNSLTGTIPTFLGNLKKLEKLVISRNLFEGGIPDELLTGSKLLGTIFADNNRLNGTLPESLKFLPLKAIRCHNNSFTGQLPTFLGELTDLRELKLSQNHFTGTIPEEFYNATSLEKIIIQGTNISGTLSAKIGHLRQLEKLDVSYNEITGPLPKELFDIPLLNIQLQDNRITGALPSFISNLNNTIRLINLSNNRLLGPIPTGSIEALSSLHELILHSNNLTGNISQAICKTKGNFFFDLSNLTVPKTVNCPPIINCCNIKL